MLERRRGRVVDAEPAGLSSSEAVTPIATSSSAPPCSMSRARPAQLQSIMPRALHAQEQPPAARRARAAVRRPRRRRTSSTIASSLRPRDPSPCRRPSPSAGREARVAHPAVDRELLELLRLRVGDRGEGADMLRAGRRVSARVPCSAACRGAGGAHGGPGAWRRGPGRASSRGSGEEGSGAKGGRGTDLGGGAGGAGDCGSEHGGVRAGGELVW